MHIFLEYSNKEPLFITNANYLFRPMNNCIIMKIHRKIIHILLLETRFK